MEKVPRGLVKLDWTESTAQLSKGDNIVTIKRPLVDDFVFPYHSSVVLHHGSNGDPISYRVHFFVNFITMECIVTSINCMIGHGNDDIKLGSMTYNHTLLINVVDDKLSFAIAPNQFKIMHFNNDDILAVAIRFLQPKYEQHLLETHLLSPEPIKEHTEV